MTRYNRTGAYTGKKKNFLRNCLIIIAALAAAFFVFFLLPRLFKNSKAEDTLAGSISLPPKQSQPKNSNEKTSGDKETQNILQSGPEMTLITTKYYDYSKPVPKREQVSEEYFKDALFIGDSRTEMFVLNSGMKEIHSHTAKGLMVDTIFTKPLVEIENGEKIPIMEALKKESYQKIYIMLGINELGWRYENIYIEKYGEIIDALKESQPDASIYVESLIPVSAEKSKKDPVYNNERIALYNNLLQKMAQEKEVYYVNVAEALSDETGALFADASSDGVHQNKKYSGVWLDYLKNHTVKGE